MDEETVSITIEIPKSFADAAAALLKLLQGAEVKEKIHTVSSISSIAGNREPVDNSNSITSLSTDRTDVEEKKIPVFEPPSLSEVAEYCKEKGYHISAEKFHSYYSRREWKDKYGYQVDNWKERVDDWEAREINKPVKKISTVAAEEERRSNKEERRSDLEKLEALVGCES